MPIIRPDLARRSERRTLGDLPPGLAGDRFGAEADKEPARSGPSKLLAERHYGRRQQEVDIRFTFGGKKKGALLRGLKAPGTGKLESDARGLETVCDYSHPFTTWGLLI